MAFQNDYLSALINETYMPVLIDQIFEKDQYLAMKLKKKAKTFNGRKSVIPLEYGESENIQETTRGEALRVSFTDEFTSAFYGNRMLTGTIAIPLEDELDDMSKASVKNLVVSKMKNLQKSLEKKFSEVLWERNSTYALPRPSKQWNTVDFLVNEGASQSVGEVIDGSTVPSWWKSTILDNSDFTGNTTLIADLVDSTKDTYLPKIFARMIAKATFRTGDFVFVVPQPIWDAYEFILDEKKDGNKYNDRLGSLGFDALNFRGSKYPIIAENDMVRAQTGDTDGRIYLLNLEYFYMMFNSSAKFKVGAFKEMENVNGKLAKVHVYGNTVISNRRAQVSVQGLYSPQAYIA